MIAFARKTGWGFAIGFLALLGACNAKPADTPAAPVIGSSISSSVASADGVQIAYDTRGEGSPVLVLVHGWSCDRTYWDAQVEPLSQDFRVVTLDLAGHGASGANRKDWTIEAYGADVAAVAEALDLKDVILVGHSMGADVVTDAARQIPERVKGVIWLDEYNQLDTPVSEEKVAEIVAPFRTNFRETTETFVRGMFPEKGDPALADRVARDMASAPPDIAIPSLAAVKSYSRSIAGVVDALDVPVVTINAANSPTDAASLERHGVNVAVLPGTGHFLMMDDPAAFNALLKKVIAETF